MYFVTCVTYNRQPILVRNADLFWTATEEVRSRLPFDLFAWVILPDHFHWIVTPNSANLSDIMRQLKVTVAARYRQQMRIVQGRFWQNRFWDHIIRNDADLAWHTNYIHYNPVKHGYVAEPGQYALSSLATLTQSGTTLPRWADVAKYTGKHGE
jgi:putative transposase